MGLFTNKKIRELEKKINLLQRDLEAVEASMQSMHSHIEDVREWGQQELEISLVTCHRYSHLEIDTFFNNCGLKKDEALQKGYRMVYKTPKKEIWIKE